MVGVNGGVIMRVATSLLCLLLPMAALAAPKPPLQFSPLNPAGHEAVLAKGERLAWVLGCRGCHNADMHGEDWTENARQVSYWTANITQALPHYTDAQLETMLRTGIRPDGSAVYVMPSEMFSRLSAPDMAALIAWLRTVPPTGAVNPPLKWGPDADKMPPDERQLAPYWLAVYAKEMPVDLGERLAWGRYLVSTTCAECHGPALNGHEKPYRPNLSVAAAYDLPAFRRLLKTGVALDGKRDLGLMKVVAKSHFAKLTDDEVKAIHDYLTARAAKG